MFLPFTKLLELKKINSSTVRVGTLRALVGASVHKTPLIKFHSVGSELMTGKSLGFKSYSTKTQHKLIIPTILMQINCYQINFFRNIKLKLIGVYKCKFLPNRLRPGVESRRWQINLLYANWNVSVKLWCLPTCIGSRIGHFLCPTSLEGFLHLNGGRLFLLGPGVHGLRSP